MKMTIIATEKAPTAIGPYSQAIMANDIVATSGQLPIVPKTGKLAEGGIREQTEQCFLNLEAILEEVSLSVKNIIKTTVYLADIKDFSAMNEVYEKHITSDYPARSAFQVGALPMGALVEIEARCVK